MRVVVLVGRPNVGKSALFNRIIGKRQSIVDSIPGVTRDALYSEVEHRGRSFYLVDTGGLYSDDEHPLLDGVRKQVLKSLEHASVAVMVVDGKTGVNPSDHEIAQLLRGFGMPVVLVVNKIDDPHTHEQNIYEAWELGLGEPFAVSAEHASGIYDLLDSIVSKLPDDDASAEEDEPAVKVAIAGRPNVGKSTLFNALIGYERSIVSDMPGTTRDSVDTAVTIGGKRYLFLDTAGIRRASRRDSSLEYYSVLRSWMAIDRSDIVLLVLDAGEPATDQDKRLADHALEKGKGIIIIVNKWDTLVGDPGLGAKFEKMLREELRFIDYSPILYISALTGRNLSKIPDVIDRVQENRMYKMTTLTLNDLLQDAIAFDRMPSDKKGKQLRIFFMTQGDVAPPTFVFFVNDPDIVTDSFTRFIDRKIRRLYPFEGTPLRIIWKSKKID